MLFLLVRLGPFFSLLDYQKLSAPYWRPCLADSDLLVPMYAHLGRDPHPASITRLRSIRFCRWVERMNRADPDAPEYYEAGMDFLADDEVPETLLAMLRVLAA